MSDKIAWHACRFWWQGVGGFAGISVACLLPVINPFMRRQMQTALSPPPTWPFRFGDPHPPAAATAAAVAVRAQIINLTNCPSDWPANSKPSEANKGGSRRTYDLHSQRICISVWLWQP